MMRAKTKVKLNRSLLGIGFIAAAVFLVMDQLHLFPFTLGFWSIFWTVIFGAALITAIVNRRIYSSIFSAAFLLIIYAKPLHIQALAPWTILLAAILLSLGIRLLYKKSFSPTIVVNGQKVDVNWSDLKHGRLFKGRKNIMDDTSFGVDSDNVVISSSMSDVSRYVHSQNLRTITIDSSMSDINVYLDDAKAAGDEVIVNFNLSMGDVNLYIPKNWQVDNQLAGSLGDVEADYVAGDGPRLVLKGRASMSDITIKHV